MIASADSSLLSNPLLLALLGLLALACVLLAAAIVLKHKRAAKTTPHTVSLDVPVKAADNSFMSALTLPVSLHYRCPEGSAYTPEQMGNYLMSQIKRLAARTSLMDLHQHPDQLATNALRQLQRRFQKERFIFEALHIQDPKPGDEVKHVFQQCATGRGTRRTPPNSVQLKTARAKRSPNTNSVTQLAQSQALNIPVLRSTVNG